MVLTTSQQTRQIIELITGFVVLIAFIVMLVLAIIGSGQQRSSGYYLKASFQHIDGLEVGSDIRLAGVTVGQVVKESIDPKTYKATVTFTLRPDIQLPVDSSAMITSDSLLGGKYIALSPGGDEKNLKPNQFLNHTQGAISIQELLSKFIFSVTDSLSKLNKTPASSTTPSNDNELKAP